METGLWNVLGWWKAVSTSEGSVVTAKCHIVALEKVGGIKRYILYETLYTFINLCDCIIIRAAQKYFM
jgi:hypothetical protein